MMNSIDTLLLYLFTFFVLLSPVMIGLAIYGMWVVINFFRGELTAWNEMWVDKLLRKYSGKGLKK